LLVGILALTESLLGILRTVNGPATNLWGPATVAAAALLAIDGLVQLSPRLHRWVLIALAVTISVGASISSEEWPLNLWVFAAAVGFVEWMFQQLEVATGRREIGSLACAMALALSLANTTFMLFRLYWDAPEFWPLGQIFRFMLPIALPWTLVVVLMVHAGREVLGTTRTESIREPETQPEIGPHSAA
jgi:hypothetical protein